MPDFFAGFTLGAAFGVIYGLWVASAASAALIGMGFAVGCYFTALVKSSGGILRARRTSRGRL